jgi:site-specific DNA-cytosine methylase
MSGAQFTALFPFGGSGGGALGFLDAEVRLLGRVGSFRCLGSIDFDAAACVDFERFTGAPAWCVDMQQVTAPELRERFGARAPDVVFLSPPCKGSSRLLSSALAATAKYQDMNRLAVVWTGAMLAAWGDDPPALVLLENVPGLPTRAAKMLRELRALLKAAGYVFHAQTHDCGELGGLAQHRERYLLVARHPKKCPSLLYQPPKRRVRGVGEVLSLLPMPATAAAAEWGALHTMPRLAWRNWLRLALIPAGGDWRDLDGVLQGRARREVFRRHAVQQWDAPHPAVTGPGGHSVEAIADPRPQLGCAPHAGAYGVVSWEEASKVITGSGQIDNRPVAVADIRVPTAYDAGYGVLRMDQPARTVAGEPSPGCGAYAVADDRARAFLTDVRVLTLDEAMALDLDPRKPPPFVPVIVAADGTWHRPMTALELASLQGYARDIRGQRLSFEGGRTLVLEHIGNSVPPPTARAIAEEMLVALVEHEAGTMLLRGDGSVWVAPEVVAS